MSFEFEWLSRLRHWFLTVGNLLTCDLCLLRCLQNVESTSFLLGVRSVDSEF